MNILPLSKLLLTLPIVFTLFFGFQMTYAGITVPARGVVEGDSGGVKWTLVPAECLDDGAPDNCGFEQVLQLIANIIGLLLVVALLLAALLFGYAGFLYATSAGNETKAGAAKKIFTNVAIGLIIVFLAYTLVQVVVSIFGVQPNYNQFLESFRLRGAT